MAFALPVGWRASFKRQACRNRLVADRQGHREHAVAVGHVGTRGIDRDRESDLPMIAPNTPFIEQQLLDPLESATLVPVEGQTP